MTAKIVCRVITGRNTLLGWVEHQASILGDGNLTSSSPVIVQITEMGFAEFVSLHWADVNCETIIKFPEPIQVVPGSSLPIYDAGIPMIQVGRVPISLAPITVGSVKIGVPVGMLGAKSLPAGNFS